jgi:hypothetical protein
MNHDVECIHGLLAGTCSYCKPKQPSPPEQIHTFRAKYEGHCNGCNLPIVIGQMVVWSPDRPAKHEGCA